MRRWWSVVAAMLALAGCMPTDGPVDGTAAGSTAVPTELPVRLSEAEVTEAVDRAGCDELAAPDEASAQHVDETAPPAAELYDQRPATAGDHLGAWVDAGVYDEAPDERAVVHNHEHGAVSVWYLPDAIEDDDLTALRGWAEARDRELANDAGAGIIVAPFDEELSGDATVAFRAWTGGLDCASFDVVVADGFLLDRFGDAPEGTLAPDLDGVVVRATAT